MFSRNVEIYTNKKNILEGSALSCSQWFSVRREQKIKCDNQKKNAQGHGGPVTRGSAGLRSPVPAEKLGVVA